MVFTSLVHRKLSAIGMIRKRTFRKRTMNASDFLIIQMKLLSFEQLELSLRNRRMISIKSDFGLFTYSPAQGWHHLLPALRGYFPKIIFASGHQGTEDFQNFFLFLQRNPTLSID